MGATESAGASAGLGVQEVRVAFDGVTALDGVGVVVHPGEVVGLIGPNGAGKTTLINAMSGLIPQMEGRRWLDGVDVTDQALPSLARRGVTRSFQGARLFNGLTLRENLEVAALGVGRRRRVAGETAERLLAGAGLESRAHDRAGSLPAGDQQRMAVLRALATSPRYLLLDEPAAGLNEYEGEALVAMLKGVRDEYGCGVLVVEHDMAVIMSLCDRVQVLNYGRSIAVGTCAEIRRDPLVIEAYLGVEHADG